MQCWGGGGGKRRIAPLNQLAAGDCLLPTGFGVGASHITYPGDKCSKEDIRRIRQTYTTDPSGRDKT